LNDEVLDENDNVSVMFAVCANLNESCILSVPTLCSFTDILNNKSCLNAYNVFDNVANDNSVSAVLTRSQARKQEPLGNNVAVSSDEMDIDNSDVTFLDIDEPAIMFALILVSVMLLNFQRNSWLMSLWIKLGNSLD